MQHICIAGLETNYVMLELTEGKKEKRWNPVRVQLKLLVAKANATNDNSYNF